MPIAGTLRIRVRPKYGFFLRILIVQDTAAKQNLEIDKKERGILRAAGGNKENKKM